MFILKYNNESFKIYLYIIVKYILIFIPTKSGKTRIAIRSVDSYDQINMRHDFFSLIWNKEYFH